MTTIVKIQNVDYFRIYGNIYHLNIFISRGCDTCTCEYLNCLKGIVFIHNPVIVFIFMWSYGEWVLGGFLIVFRNDRLFTKSVVNDR